MRAWVTFFSLWFGTGSAWAATRTLEVSNPSPLGRPDAMVEIPLSRIQEQFGKPDHQEWRVTDAATGQEIVVQRIDEARARGVLLFLTNLGPHETRRFTIEDRPSAARADPARRTYGRFVPERQDDFAWENELVAFRMYGPALAAEGAQSGVDCWLKRVTSPIIDKWYRLFLAGTSYHEDRGEGYDPYHVGRSRGCGGSALWIGGRFHPTTVFASYRVVANGPLRTVFELVYPPRSEGGRSYTETRRMTLDLGQRLTRVDLTLKAGEEGLSVPVGIGLTTHEGRAQPAFDRELGVMSAWEVIDGSGLGTGVVVDPQLVREMLNQESSQPDEAHAVTVTRTNRQGNLTYWTGYGWERAGAITTFQQWQNHLRAFAVLSQNPLQLRWETRALEAGGNEQ